MVDKISAEQVKEDLEAAKDFVLLDVRTMAEFRSGYIEGAINIPLQILPYEVENKIARKDQTIVLYCRRGVRTIMAAEILEDLGYTSIYDMGEIISWPYGLVKK